MSIQINEDELKKARDEMFSVIKALDKEERVLYLMLLAVVLKDQVQKTDYAYSRELSKAHVLAYFLFEGFKEHNTRGLEREVVMCFQEHFANKTFSPPKDETYINFAFLYYIYDAVMEHGGKSILFKYQSYIN